MESKSTLVFAADHPAFAGHFPGAPIVPGVLLLDAAMHALAAQSGQAITDIASAKFLQPVRPGEALGLECRLSGTGRAGFDISNAGQRVATGQLTLAESR